MLFIARNDHFSLCDQFAQLFYIKFLLLSDNLHLRGHNPFSRRIHLCCIIFHIFPPCTFSPNDIYIFWLFRPLGLFLRDFKGQKEKTAKCQNRISQSIKASLRWHYPNQVMGQSDTAYSQPVSTSSPLFCFIHFSIRETLSQEIAFYR